MSDGQQIAPGVLVGADGIQSRARRIEFGEGHQYLRRGTRDIAIRGMRGISA